MASGTKYRMKISVDITRVVPDEKVMTQHGPMAKETAGESVQAIAEGHSRGRCLDDIMDDSPVGELLKRIQEEQRQARGILADS